MSPTPIQPGLLTRLYQEARAERWRVSRGRFAEVLAASAAKGLGVTPGSNAVESYLRALHLADLALACACADGDEEAWEHFVRDHRVPLYRAADAMMPGGGGRELADALYGELFGVAAPKGERRSLFRYFHGRASLATWLRAVLAQRLTDRARATRKLDPLPEDDAPQALPQPVQVHEPERPLWVVAVRRAMLAATRGLTDRDRLRLSLYYAQDLTLAQIGRMLGEHEATVSRHLSRTRRDLRATAEAHLREREGMTSATVAECLSSVVRDAGSLDLRELLGDLERKELDSDRSQ